MSLLSRFSMAFLFAALLCLSAHADEPILLLGTIMKWRYPDAELGKSQMSDAATISSDGKNTDYSIVLKTTMTTVDPVDKVIAFYRDLLSRNPKNDANLGIRPSAGRSAVFSDDSEGRPFSIHTIIVNTANMSTTLIVTRADGEKLTHITWKHYLKPDIGG